jgi:hypothetical protein
MGSMVATTFDSGTQIVRNPINVNPSSNSGENLLATGIQFGSMTQGGTDVDVFILPTKHT